MNIRTRFAPSPTGRLHPGHAYSAWVAWELARTSGGEFLLRHEDIDATRVRPEYYTAIEEDLRWLGMSWREPALRQTDRTSAYASALETLKGRGVVYPCFCTRREIQEEISRMGGAPQGSDTLVYPGTCRNLPIPEQRHRLDSGATCSWRLNADKAAVQTGGTFFHDLRHGVISTDPALLGDVVLARKDIGVAYHLAVVVDDSFQKITHVTRGEDLLPSTHVHRLLQALLNLPVPVYFHHPLVVDEEGRRLAKRDDDESIESMRNRQLSPQAVLALARKGMPPLPDLNPRGGDHRSPFFPPPDLNPPGGSP